MSLYTIQNNLHVLFQHIEDNDGEISEEMFAELQITKENFKEKLGNYFYAITNYKGDVAATDVELKRLTATKKVKENRINRLKSAMLDAILLYGDDGKSGNKVIELPTVKMFTKSNSSIETDDLRIDLLIGEFSRLVNELVNGGVLYTGSDVELQGILDVINANLKAEFDNHDVDQLGLDGVKEYKPYTLKDLTTLTLSITTKQTIYDLFRNGKDALVLLANNPFNTKIVNSTSKDDWKGAIQASDIMNKNNIGNESGVLVSYPTVAKIATSQSLTIK